MPLAKPTKPDAITAVPTPVPLRTDRANFAARGDAMMGWFPDGIDEINTTSDYMDDAANFVEQEANEAEASATAAEASNVAAAGNAAAAAASAGATVWVTGSTYTAGVVRYSPTNFSTYRDTVGGLSSTDPASDTTGRWQSAMLPSAEAIGLPNVAPTILINALHGLSNVSLTVNRSDPKGRFGQTGLWVTDPGGVLGTSYDPKTKKSLGWHIAPSTTFLGTHSGAIAANWDATRVTLTDAAALGLDGLMSMTKAEAHTDATGTNIRAVTATAGAQYYRIRVKKGSGASEANRFAFRNANTASLLTSITFDYDTGVVTHLAGAGATSEDLGNGFWLLSLPATSGITIGDTLEVYACFTGGGHAPGQFAYFTQPQVSNQPHAPYYVTSGANSVRTRDALTVTGPAFTDNWNQREGTVVMSFDDVGGNFNRHFFTISDGTENNRMGAYSVGPDITIYAVSGGVAQAILIFLNALSTNSATTGVVVGLRFSQGVFTALVRGKALQSAAAAALPTVNQCHVGCYLDSTAQISSNFKIFKSLPAAVSDTEFVALANNA